MIIWIMFYQVWGIVDLIDQTQTQKREFKDIKMC